MTGHHRLHGLEKSGAHARACACGGGGGWHRASGSGCLPLAAPIGLSPLLIRTLCGPERVLVVSTEPPDDLSCLTTPGVGCPGDGAVARAVDQGHPGAHSESMRGFADSSTDLCALGLLGGLQLLLASGATLNGARHKRVAKGMRNSAATDIPPAPLHTAVHCRWGHGPCGLRAHCARSTTAGRKPHVAGVDQPSKCWREARTRRAARAEANASAPTGPLASDTWGGPGPLA